MASASSAHTGSISTKTASAPKSNPSAKSSTAPKASAKNATRAGKLLMANASWLIFSTPTIGAARSGSTMSAFSALKGGFSTMKTFVLLLAICATLGQKRDNANPVTRGTSWRAETV